jgi:dihydrofolate reductase
VTVFDVGESVSLNRAIRSLDGRTCRAANEATAGTGIHLLGRRMYELMRHWDEPQEGASGVEAEFHRAWAPAQKVVYSRSLDEVGPNARIEREFDPVAARALADASDSDVAIGGANLGGQALRARHRGCAHARAVPGDHRAGAAGDP